MASRVLVVCYSRGGTTLRVGTRIADALSADLDRIEENGTRMGVGGYFRSAVEALARGLPTIHTRRAPRDYDLVVLGTPVWMGTISSPIRTYLFLHRGHLKNPAFFAVMGGRGGDNAVHEMQLACDKNRAPTCVFTEGDVRQNRYVTKCDSFIQSLRDASTGRDASAATGMFT